MGIVTCPMCGSSIHTPPQTWEVRCSRCKEAKYPRAIVRPDPYVCTLCRAISPAKVIQRHEKAARGAATRRAKRGVAAP